MERMRIVPKDTILATTNLFNYPDERKIEDGIRNLSTIHTPVTENLLSIDPL